MLFNSYFFILAFLPLCTAGFYLLSRFGKNVSVWFLTGMSLWFYGSFSLRFLFLLAGSIVFNFLISKSILSFEKVKRRLMLLGIGANIALLIYYKYMNFFIDSFNHLFGTQYSFLKILLPVGISYFTIQQIAYLADAYRGECENTRFDEYLLYVIYFPHIISGPILLQEDFIPRIRSKEFGKWNADNFARGINQFVFGLAKKALIADQLGPLVDYAYLNVNAMSSAELLLAVFSYVFQLYFDFSGYSDMATGISHMLSIPLPINFDSPYKSLSFGEFWRRWHVTLGRFFRKYLYIPMGGNRKGKIALIRNTLIVFLLSGIWHGANYTFAIWGLIHGIFVVVTNLFRKQYEMIPKYVRLFITFLPVSLLWGLFRADSIGQYALIMKKIFSFSDFGISGPFSDKFHIPGSETAMRFIFPGISRLQTNITSLVLVLIWSFVFCISANNNYRRTFRLNFATALAVSGLLMLSLLSFSHVTSFIYINF